MSSWLVPTKAEVYQDDYPRALTGSKTGIGFLRKACPDQHTTRTFEIPACGSLLLAERIQHQELFEEGKEAEFFSSSEELLEKTKFYCSNESATKRIAEGGYKRCRKGKYSYVHHLSTALDALARLSFDQWRPQLSRPNRFRSDIPRCACGSSIGSAHSSRCACDRAVDRASRFKRPDSPFRFNPRIVDNSLRSTLQEKCYAGR
jgi:hypothetical protein